MLSLHVSWYPTITTNYKIYLLLWLAMLPLAVARPGLEGSPAPKNKYLLVVTATGRGGTPNCSSTVDGSEILHQLRLVVFPIIYRVSYIPGGAGFLPSTVCPLPLSELTENFFLRFKICSLHYMWPKKTQQGFAICTCTCHYHLVEIIHSDQISIGNKIVSPGEKWKMHKLMCDQSWWSFATASTVQLLMPSGFLWIEWLFCSNDIFMWKVICKASHGE